MRRVLNPKTFSVWMSPNNIFIEGPSHRTWGKARETKYVEKAWQWSKKFVKRCLHRKKIIKNQKNTNVFGVNMWISVLHAGSFLNSYSLYDQQVEVEHWEWTRWTFATPLVWIKWERSIRRASKTKINYNSGNKLFSSNRPAPLH